MLKCVTNQENETLDRITFLFRGSGILFALVGGAACREYGLRRPTKDLDFVVKPYPLATAIPQREVAKRIYRSVLLDLGIDEMS